MISERQFSSKYSSVWNDLLPMSDKYMRVLNLKADQFLEPHPFMSPASFNAYVNEAAFRIAISPEGIKSIDDKKYTKICKEARKYIEKVGNTKIVIGDSIQPEIDTDISDMAVRIQKFLSDKISIVKKAVFSPKFPGCGFIQTCVGDILCDHTLYEVKAGMREFRAVDLRQLLTYAALNAESDTFNITHLSLLNPRTGKYWIGKLSEISIAISGLPESELLNSIVNAISMDKLSH